MSEYGQDLGKAAKQAFSSPTNLTAQRVGRRVSSNQPNFSSSNKSVTSARSRRSASVITTSDEAELFDRLISATSVKVRNKTKQQHKKLSDSFFGAPSSLLQSFSMPLSPGSPGSPASPNSLKSNFSAEYSPESNYFSPGGTLSIASPGRVEEERALQKDREEAGLKVPALDEKKTAEVGDEVRHVARKADTAINADAAESATKRPSQPVMVAKQRSNEEVMHLGTLDETESEDKVEGSLKKSFSSRSSGRK